MGRIQREFRGRSAEGSGARCGRVKWIGALVCAAAWIGCASSDDSYSPHSGTDAQGSVPEAGPEESGREGSGPEQDAGSDASGDTTAPPPPVDGGPVDGPAVADVSGPPPVDSGNGGEAGRPSSVSGFVVDVPNVVRRSNVILGRANTAPKEFMALGNGALGMAAWAANGFTAQLNRTDTFPGRKSLGHVLIPGLGKLPPPPTLRLHLALLSWTPIHPLGRNSSP